MLSLNGPYAFLYKSWKVESISYAYPQLGRGETGREEMGRMVLVDVCVCVCGGGGYSWNYSPLSLITPGRHSKILFLSTALGEGWSGDPHLC